MVEQVRRGEQQHGAPTELAYGTVTPHPSSREEGEHVTEMPESVPGKSPLSALRPLRPPKGHKSTEVQTVC